GPESNWELAFLNPFIFYHEVQLNGPVTGNTFGSVDFALYPFKNFSLFGEFLIDDIQLEKSIPADLEPNELGFILGIQITDPFKMSGTHFIAEYTRVANRTYNSFNPWEKFLHRQEPIGHFLGNDFDHWDVNINQWLYPGLQISIGFERIRRGEGRIQKEFDRPWLNFTVEEGYSEPFPTGVVEKTNVAKFEIIYHPWANLRVNFAGKFRDVKNVENALGLNNSEFDFVLGLWYEGDLRFSF
ncbi:MAG: capsule assembly Wzi family protein, partial [bacterium]